MNLTTNTLEADLYITLTLVIMAHEQGSYLTLNDGLQSMKERTESEYDTHESQLANLAVTAYITPYDAFVEYCQTRIKQIETMIQNTSQDIPEAIELPYLQYALTQSKYYTR